MVSLHDDQGCSELLQDIGDWSGRQSDGTPTMHALSQSFVLPDLARWRAMVTEDPLALLLDFDGTLVDFAPTPEQARLDDEVAGALTSLVQTGAHVLVVSGRPLESLAAMVPIVPGIGWFAEHGAWRRFGDRWEGPGRTASDLDELASTLSALARAPGARFERKTLSVCFHWRMVPAGERAELIAAAELACDEWLDGHPGYELLPGHEMLEVRARDIHKGTAVRFARQKWPGARIIAVGDDVTDEDMFAELGDGDAAITVGRKTTRTVAAASLAGPRAVREFLRWVAHQRAGATQDTPPLGPVVETRLRVEKSSLLVMSNRMPAASTGRRREVGGLVAALEPALGDRAAVWLGWSGHEREGTSQVVIDPDARPARACFDLPSMLRERFYGGFCNRALWPLFHEFPSRVQYSDADWKAYVQANELFAQHASQLVGPDATIWVHDYHLLLVAKMLRARGHRGPIGMFLHVPFPPRDLFETLPWREELLAGLLAFDLVGLHTSRWQENLLATAAQQPGALVDGHRIHYRGRTTLIDAFPIEIDPEPFRVVTEDAPDVAGLRAAMGSERKLLLGVDRLDYSKGVPERLLAFERLLEDSPTWRRRVSFVQVSVPSRAELPEYAELRRRVENLVGRINGKFGEADWVPVRYLYRSFDHTVLAQLYRLAHVALVTPLRDGMNLVAKEFIAAQDPQDPGVLVLSHFAGAAEQLAAALLTNPYHPEGMAVDFARALEMTRDERITRHRQLLGALERGGDATTWATRFLDALARAPLSHARPAARSRSVMSTA